jgi:lysophospholipase L1-like esterase
LRRLLSETHAKVAVIEIPILGEDLDSETNKRVNTYNDALRAVAAEQGVNCLPLHDLLVELLPPDHVPPRYQAKAGPMMKAQFQHHVLHRSWDAAAAGNGLILLSDHTHLGERAAAVVADLVTAFVAVIVTAS